MSLSNDSSEKGTGVVYIKYPRSQYTEPSSSDFLTIEQRRDTAPIASELISKGRRRTSGDFIFSDISRPVYVGSRMNKITSSRKAKAFL